MVQDNSDIVNFTDFTDAARLTYFRAADTARQLRSATLEPIHLLLALADTDDHNTSIILARHGITSNSLMPILIAEISEEKCTNKAKFTVESTRKSQAWRNLTNPFTRAANLFSNMLPTDQLPHTVRTSESVKSLLQVTANITYNILDKPITDFRLALAVVSCNDRGILLLFNQLDVVQKNLIYDFAHN